MAPSSTTTEQQRAQRAGRNIVGALRSPRVRAVLALLFYVGWASYVTWPLVTDLQHRIYGASGDLTGGIANLRELLQEGRVPFLPGTLHDFNAPTGVPVNWALNVATFPAALLLWLLGLAFGATAALGLYTLIALVFSAWAMYLLVRRVTGSEGAALIAGLAFGFYPFATINGQGHADFSHGWPLVLVLWRLLELWEAPTRRNGLLLGAATALACSWSPYYVLIAGVEYATLAAALLIFTLVLARGTWRASLRAIAWSIPPVLLYLGVSFAATAADKSGTGVRTHAIQELIVYSARWREYVTPPATNPVFGDEGQRYLASHLHGSNFTESTLYVGVSCLLLAIVGLVLNLRRTGGPRAWAASPLSRATLLAVVLGVAAFVWSSPPHVSLLGHEIPTPSDFVFRVTSTFRAYSRFVVAVMCATAFLAGLGIAALTRGRRPVVALLLTAFFGVVVVGDTWGRLVGRTNDIQAPTIYKTLKAEPPGLVAEYPLEPAGYGVYNAQFYQQYHGKPILNGYREGSPEEAAALQLADLSDPATAPGLAARGVKYVLLTSQPKTAPGPGPGTPGRGYRFLGEDSYAKLYRVTAAPPVASVDLGAGFGLPELDGMNEFRWLLQPTGELNVRGRCTVCEGVLTFRSLSFGQPRSVEVLGAAGKVLASRRVPTDQKVTFRIPLRFRRTARLTLRTSPGPQSIAETLGGGGDDRSVSVRIQEPTFRLVKR